MSINWSRTNSAADTRAGCLQQVALTQKLFWISFYTRRQTPMSQVLNNSLKTSASDDDVVINERQFIGNIMNHGRCHQDAITEREEMCKSGFDISI
jgi:hypothetical protein